MVVEPISPSSFQAATSLNPPYRNYRDALSLDTDFLEEISAAYTRAESPASSDFFDLELSPDGFSGAVLEGSLAGDVPASREVTVSEGTVTFSSSSGSGELVAAPFHDVRMQRNDENTITVINRTTDRAVRLEEGESLTISGDGQAELDAGDDRSLRLEAGQSVALSVQDDSLRLKRTTFRDSIDLSQGPRPVTARGETGSEITLYTGPNETLRFEAGETGAVERTADGTVRLTNERTEESLSIAPTDTLKAAGEAGFAIGEEPAFEMEEGDSVRLFDGDGSVEIRNQSVVGSVPLNGSVTSPDRDALPDGISSKPAGGQARVYGQLLGEEQSPLNLAESPPSLRERLVDSSDPVIEPLSERDSEGLIGGGLTLGEESVESPFLAEREVPEPFEELPSILGENGDGLRGE